MKDNPEPVDVKVGGNIRLLRQKRNISQTELADKIGVTFQQVQKYEKGTNRVSASRLVQIAGVFGVPVATLFDGVENSPGDGDAPAALPVFSREAFMLVRDFESISDPDVKLTIRGLVRSIARQKHAGAA